MVKAPSDPEELREAYMVGFEQNAEDGRRIVRWLERSHSLSLRLAERRYEFEGLYWTHLFGIIRDARNYHMLMAEEFLAFVRLARKTDPSLLVESAANNREQLMHALTQAHEKLLGRFSRSERIFLQYMRHSHCHATLSGYNSYLRGRKGQERVALYEDIAHDGIGVDGGVTYDKYKAAIEAVLSEHGRSTSAAATAFSAKSIDDVSHVLSMCSKVHRG